LYWNDSIACDNMNLKNVSEEVDNPKFCFDKPENKVNIYIFACV